MATVNLGSVVPKVKVGTVTTLQPEENATVTVTGSGKEAVFDFGIPQGLGADAQFWTGTVEEFETDENTIEEGTIVNLTDDTLEDGDLIGVATLNRIASVESDVDNLDAETTKKEDMLSTMEEIEANTTEDKYASALAVKEGFDEINNSLTVKEFHVNWTTYWGVNGFALSNANIKILNVQITVPITGDIPAHVETLVGQITSDFAIPASNIMTTFGTYSGNVGTLIIKPNGDIIIFSANIITQGDTLYVNMCW